MITLLKLVLSFEFSTSRFHPAVQEPQVSNRTKGVGNRLGELVLASVSYLKSHKENQVFALLLLALLLLDADQKTRTIRHLRNVCGGCIVNISVYKH